MAIYWLPHMEQNELVFRCFNLKCPCELRAKVSPSNRAYNYELYYNARFHQCFYPYDAFYTILSPDPDWDFSIKRPLVQRLDKVEEIRDGANRAIFMMWAKPHKLDQLPNYFGWGLNIELRELETSLKRRIRDLKDSLSKTLKMPKGTQASL